MTDSEDEDGRPGGVPEYNIADDSDDDSLADGEITHLEAMAEWGQNARVEALSHEGSNHREIRTSECHTRNCGCRSEAEGDSTVRRESPEAEDREESPLNSLVEILPESVKAMEGQEEWQELKMAVDSGASATVISEDMIPAVPLSSG